MTRSAWRDPFPLVRGCCLAFFFLSLVSMVMYPGGHYLDRTSGHYEFFHNFLSDLGRTRAYNGATLPTANTLFLLAVILAGIGMGLFFHAFPLTFAPSKGQTALRWLSSWFGATAGGCFIVVALAPADTMQEVHYGAVNWAFRNYLFGVMVLTASIYLDKTKPRKAAVIFLLFAACVAAYIGLLTRGPSPATPSGLLIQATGQKVIVYASVLTLYVQSWRAQRWLAQRSEPLASKR